MSFTIKNLLLAGLFLALFLFVGAAMRKTGLGFGEVVGFEFSFFTKNTEATVANWQAATMPNGQTKLAAMTANTWLDFCYIIGYVFLGVFLARAAAGEKRLATARRIAALLFVAGLCDVVENLQILQIMEGDFGLRPMLMSVCAAVKFVLLLVSLGWAASLVAAQIIGQAHKN